MVIAAFFNILVKPAHRKTVTMSSLSHVPHKIIYKRFATGVDHFQAV